MIPHDATANASPTSFNNVKLRVPAAKLYDIEDKTAPTVIITASGRIRLPISPELRAIYVRNGTIIRMDVKRVEQMYNI